MMELFIIFMAIVAIVYVSQRHKERMSLIKKGEHAGKIKFRDNRSELLNAGIFLVGIAIGFVVGAVLASYNIFSSDISYVSMIMLFGGIALVLTNFISKQNKEKESNTEDES